MKIDSFAFCVLSYNHEEYIIEHLESIKFLIAAYGKGIRFQIILNDDCSLDNTVSLADRWLSDNAGLFDKVDRIFNVSNVGTCKSVLNILDRLSSSYWKLTASDDVYSCENMFDWVGYTNRYEIISGVPLDLREGVISRRLSDIINIMATDLIYAKSSLLDRLKGISVNNAPNIFYKAESIKEHSVLEFIGKHDVVEDLPIQVAIAERQPASKALLIDKVFVYYRRTPGSTYIVASKRFSKDQINIFNYLICGEPSFFKKLMLKNRLFCFLLKHRMLKKMLNLSIYVYVIKLILVAVPLRTRFNHFRQNNPLDSHIEHYKKIKSSSRLYIMNLKQGNECSRS